MRLILNEETEKSSKLFFKKKQKTKQSHKPLREVSNQHEIFSNVRKGARYKIDCSASLTLSIYKVSQ